MKHVALVLFAFFIISATTKYIELENKVLLDGKIEMKIPSGFEEMDEERMKLKYPSEKRPTLVFTNETGIINVALNLTEHPAGQENIAAYQEGFVQTFKSIYPSAEWLDEGTTEINGRKAGFLELITPAVDTEIYNLIFFTDVEGKLLLVNFNCTIESMDKWVPAGKEIMNSLKVK